MQIEKRVKEIYVVGNQEFNDYDAASRYVRARTLSIPRDNVVDVLNTILTTQLTPLFKQSDDIRPALGIIIAHLEAGIGQDEDITNYITECLNFNPARMNKPVGKYTNNTSSLY